jgi:hypothetical protein
MSRRVHVLLLAVVVCTAACAPDGFAVGVPSIAAPADTVDLGNLPLDVQTPFEIPFENVGYGDALATVTFTPADAAFDGPRQFRIPARSQAPYRGNVRLDVPTPRLVTITAAVGDSVARVEVRVAGQLDQDGDGFLSVAAGGPDCNDLDPGINPDAVETCDGVDEDCNGTVDDPAEPIVWYADSDADGFGDVNAPLLAGCATPSGHVANALDCDDTDSAVNPSRPEIWYDGVDQDCDGNDDDRDGDGVPVDVDCNDLEPSAFPGGIEVEDGIDQDCDGVVDEDFASRGNLVISEVHTQPSIPTGKYIEIFNLGPNGIDPGLLALNGVPIAAPFVLVPGQVGVLCDEDDRLQNGNIDCSGEAPIPESGVLALTLNGQVLDEVDLAIVPTSFATAADIDFPSLDPDDNDVPGAWCPSAEEALSGDAGTPNALPPTLCD